jgi:hypothetical protein
MKSKVFVLALLVLIGNSCKHKTATENTPAPQETPQPTTPQPQTPNHHGSDDEDAHEGRHHKHEHDEDEDDQGEDHDKHHHKKKHHRLPPGQEKKLHGDQSARDYAPGHKK